MKITHDPAEHGVTSGNSLRRWTIWGRVAKDPELLTCAQEPLEHLHLLRFP